ncbi:DUF4310 family protein [Faecalicoccus pleomorphus]|nr:DUF4310 family protein [Faecalicoccus pleomorphus]
MKKLFMNDWFFIAIMVLMCAGVMGGVHMYLTYGTGYMNVLVGGQLLQSGDYAQAAGFGGGFLLARILEGPLVGILDIGGSIMMGVGCGLVGIMYSIGLGWMLENFVMSLIAGAVIGACIGLIIMAIRKLVPNGVQAGGSDIMMGVGHQLANWLAPLFLISALATSVPLGVFGALGGAVAYKFDKNLVGGIIIGMFIAAFFWPVSAA